MVVLPLQMIILYSLFGAALGVGIPCLAYWFLNRFSSRIGYWLDRRAELRADRRYLKEAFHKLGEQRRLSSCGGICYTSKCISHTIDDRQYTE